MADINVTQIKYLDHEGLITLWEKISNVFLRDSEVINTLTTYGDGQIITQEGDVFVQKTTLDELNRILSERMDDIEAAQGTNIDDNTIVNKEGKLQTDLLLSNDKDNHILSIVTGKGNTVSTWDYTEFYNEAVKDGILETVSLVVIPGDETTEASGQDSGTYLKFVFNTSSGKTPLYVNVTDLIDVYTGSNYIEVTKSGETSTINLKTAELVNYLKQEEVLGLTSMVTRIENIENQISGIEQLVKTLQEAWENLDITGLEERIETNEINIEAIFKNLETVPNTPITTDEINALE